MSFQRISVEEGKRIIDADNAVILDVRDPQSYAAAHIEGAVNIDNNNIAEFVEKTEKSLPLVIYCYHGNMSLGGAGYLMEHGFEDVCSMSGGFEAWRGRHPAE